MASALTFQVMSSMSTRSWSPRARRTALTSSRRQSRLAASAATGPRTVRPRSFCNRGIPASLDPRRVTCAVASHRTWGTAGQTVQRRLAAKCDPSRATDELKVLEQIQDWTVDFTRLLISLDVPDRDGPADFVLVVAQRHGRKVAR